MWLTCPRCVFVDKLFSFSLDRVLVKVPMVPTHRVMCPHADGGYRCLLDEGEGSVKL